MIIKKNGVEFDRTLGGAVLHHKDPDRVEGGIQAAKTKKKNEKAAAKVTANAETSETDSAIDGLLTLPTPRETTSDA